MGRRTQHKTVPCPPPITRPPPPPPLSPPAFFFTPPPHPFPPPTPAPPPRQRLRSLSLPSHQGPRRPPPRSGRRLLYRPSCRWRQPRHSRPRRVWHWRTHLPRAPGIRTSW